MSQDQNCQIAIIDDYAYVAETIATYIRRMGCIPVLFVNPLDFLDALQNTSFNIVITDLRMPQMDGLSLLKKIKERAPDTEVIVVSAHADKHDAIEALKLGAYDFFEKPVTELELVTTIKRTLGYQDVLRQRDALAQRMAQVTEETLTKWGSQAFVGHGAAAIAALNKVLLLQKSTKTNVLVLGESGTGKELVARAIHFGSLRAEAPFVAVNCSAIPDELAESILFGHIKGSFTGAFSDRKGQFELAEDGTLFLDEIGDMPPLVQAKLLRVLDDGIVIPIGKASGRRVDVRVISATNANLEERTASGRFRPDLYHRLAGYVVQLPPLRERLEDLPSLINHFVLLLSKEMGIQQPKVSQDYIDTLCRYHFPGNIRELRNILERSLIDARGTDLEVEHLPVLPVAVSPVPVSPGSVSELPAAAPLAPGPSSFTLKQAEKAHVQRVMEYAKGNIAEAARLLDISRARIYRILD